MNKIRAKEIATSPVMANVTYNGDSVYIEKVNEIKDTASIHLLHQPQTTREVPLTTLIEQ